LCALILWNTDTATWGKDADGVKAASTRGFKRSAGSQRPLSVAKKPEDDNQRLKKTVKQGDSSNGVIAASWVLHDNLICDSPRRLL